jgi:Domain of unknown function (DUF892)
MAYGFARNWLTAVISSLVLPPLAAAKSRRDHSRIPLELEVVWQVATLVREGTSFFATTTKRMIAIGIFSRDIKTMDDMFVQTLRDIYYAEKQIAKALPDMIEKSHDVHHQAIRRLGEARPAA